MLRLMFFLEYFIKGAWFPLLGLYMGDRYLNFRPVEQAWVFNCFAITTLTGLFLGGQLADRLMARERYLALSHLIGGLAMLALPRVRSFWPFFGLVLLHCFFYVPTLSVANAIAFDRLDAHGARKDFGTLRLWGSIGWVAASWPLIFIPIDWARVRPIDEAGGFVAWLGSALSTLKTGPAMESAMTGTFVVSGIASLILAAVSLALPRTPPSKSIGEPFAPVEAIKLLARPSVLVLFVVTFFDSLAHLGYYFWTSRYFQSLGVPENWIAPAMSIGQVMEVVAMAMLGAILARLGWRRTLILGVLAQAVRFAVYAIGSRDLVWMVVGVNLVHGFAYACFFATVFIFVDAHFPEDARSSAQGLFNLMILGISQLASGFLWGGLGGVFATIRDVGGKSVATIAYHRLFLVPMGLSLLAAAILALFFRPPDAGPGSEKPPIDREDP
jgi:MFS family permease